MFKAKIISNLEPHRAKWVNPFIALSGLIYKNYEEGESSPFDELNELIVEGLVEKKTVELGYDKFERPIHGDLYRYTPPINWNGNKLTLVT